MCGLWPFGCVRFGAEPGLGVGTMAIWVCKVRGGARIGGCGLCPFGCVRFGAEPGLGVWTMAIWVCKVRGGARIGGVDYVHLGV